MKKALAFLITSFCLSCGIKGPPLPPIDESVARKQKAESVTVSTSTAQSSVSASGDTTKVIPTSDANAKKNKK